MSTTETAGQEAGYGQYKPPLDEAAEFAKFQAAQARQALVDEALRGNGSPNPFVRWLTRKPLPVKMTANRVICGLIWAFWTLVCMVAIFVSPDAGTGFMAFLFAALCGFYDWRIWTRRATSLWFFIVW